MITRQQRHGGFLHQRLGRRFRPHRPHRRRRRPDEHDSRRGAGFRERRIFRQEAVAGMNRVRPGGQRRVDYPGNIQVTVARRRRADRIRPIRRLHVQRVRIGFRDTPRSFRSPSVVRCEQRGRRFRRDWRSAGNGTSPVTSGTRRSAYPARVCSMRPTAKVPAPAGCPPDR